MWAILVWTIPLLLISVSVAVHPQHRTITGVYHEASEAWWQNQNLYRTGPGPAGFYYLPQFAILFAPFHAIPTPVGDILWRWLSLGVLVHGWWKLTRLVSTNNPDRLFFWSSVLGIASCLASIRNGQANVILAGLFVQAVACLIQARWWLASLCLIVAIALKPLGLVMLVLALFGYPPIRSKVLIAAVAFVLLPFCCAAPGYVLSQLYNGYVSLWNASLITPREFADISGLLKAAGVELSQTVSQWARVTAGALTLVCWWLGIRRTDEPFRGLLLLALSTACLMLFNPMTEANSYVLLAPAVAIVAVHCMETDLLWLGRIFAGIIVSIGVLPELVRRQYSHVALWWNPLMTILFIVLLLWYLPKVLRSGTICPDSHGHHAT